MALGGHMKQLNPVEVIDASLHRILRYDIVIATSSTTHTFRKEWSLRRMCRHSQLASGDLHAIDRSLSL